MGGMRRDDPKFRIDPTAFRRGASALGCEPEALQAVVAVGFLDTGFDPDGIAPRVQFDARWFSRITDGEHDAEHPDLSNPNAYPSGAEPNHSEHERLRRAMALDRTAAIASAAWGRFQIMGFWWERAGCSSAQHFVEQMYSSETAQFDCFLQLLVHFGHAPALEEHRWADFMRVWEQDNRSFVRPAAHASFAAEVRAAFRELKGVTA
jgi:hypothetical protein